MDIITILRDLVKCKFNLQKWINNRFQDPDKVILERIIVNYIVTPEGLKFYIDSEEDAISQVLREYSFEDLRPDDIVLDLGANIGAFSIRASQKCRHVFAVEPLYTEQLRRNVLLNDLQKKISILPCAIGNGDTISVSYKNLEKVVKTYPLSEIVKMTGPISFLKCDIEGAEWSLEPKDIQNIRRLEFEVHQGRDSCMPENPLLIEYIYNNWDTKVDFKKWPNKGYYIHAYPQKGII